MIDFDTLVEMEATLLATAIQDILAGKKDTLKSVLFQIMSRTASWRYEQDHKTTAKYPKTISDHIVQYDENVFVWIDETGNVGGASPTLEQAQKSLERYVKHCL
jgi:hypothetical protein